MSTEQNPPSKNAQYREYVKKHTEAGNANPLSFKDWLINQKTDANHLNVDGKNVGNEHDTTENKVDVNETKVELPAKEPLKIFGMHPLLAVGVLATVSFIGYKLYQRYKK